MNEQHDVNEFYMLLSEALETQMRGTPVEGTYSKLFEGTIENVIECTEIDYESSRKEQYNCLQFNIDSGNMENAFKDYCQYEELNGDNQYDAGEENGK